MKIALLLSGGIGTRLHSDLPKQYIRVNGKMVITYSLATLAISPMIDAIQIVAQKEWWEHILADAKQTGINTSKIIGFSTPGSHRQASILNGLRDILLQRDEAGKMPGTTGREGMRNEAERRPAAAEYDLVMIHDAARPMLTEKQIRECFIQQVNHDGVMPVLPMKDTVYLSEDGNGVSQLLEREKLFAGQAPEVFKLQKYYQANLALKTEGLSKINGSTEPAVMAGMDIAMIPGDENNFKITTDRDLKRFQKIVEEERG